MAPRDLLDYYLGPTGIPDRIRALNELNPVAGIMRGMSASGRAADPSRPAADRRSAAGEAAMETGIALLPVGMGRLASLFRVPQATAAASMADEAADAVETFTAYRPEATPAMVEEEIDRGFEPQVGPDPFQQTPFVFDPDDVPDPFDLEGPQPTDAQIAQFQAEQAAEAAAPNPWANVAGAEDMAAAYGADPFRGIPGSRVLPNTAPAATIAEANPYMPTNDVFQMPRTWADQGVAGIYSRSGRAAAQLRQPRYSDIETLRRELEARGASPSELNYQLGQFEEALFDGPISREDIQDFFSNYETGLMIDRNLDYAGGYMPPGGQNATSTVYYHPEGQNYPRGARRHFPDLGNSTGQNAAPLFHSRAAQYDLGFPDGGTTHHVAEIQSDFAQYRQAIPKEDRDAFDQQYDAPYIRRENDWVDAAIRQNLLDAVNSGSDWITFGNGRQANQHIGMPREAAESFYDTRVPRRLEDVLRRFSNQTGIEAPRLERIPFVDGDDVLGFRITPEFQEALIKNGLPSYKNGGIVSLL
jgi:hypothetical protein